MSILPERPLDMFTFQTDGIIDYRPDLEGMNRFWFYETPQVPWSLNTGQTPAGLMAGLSLILPPSVDTMRAPYHHDYFVEATPGDLTLHPLYMQFLKLWAASGRKVVWDWHDGPTQEIMSGTRRQVAPNIYPPTSTREETNAAFTFLGQRQIAGYLRLLDMLDRPEHADLKAASVGFELMNEPASYLQAAQRFNDPAYFHGLFVDHVEALANLVKARMPGRFLIAPAAAYNGRIDVLVQAFLPQRGMSAWDAMVQAVGLSHMILGIHFYPGFDQASRTQADHTRNFTQRFGAAGSIPIAITETNIDGAWMGTDRRGGNAWRSFFIARHLDYLREGLWPGKKACGITFWPFMNYANNSVIRVQRGGALQDDYRNTRAAWVNQLAHRDGQDPRYFGAVEDQAGIKGYSFIGLNPFNSIRPQGWEPDGWHLLLGQGLSNSEITHSGDAAISYGGRGLTVHTPPGGTTYSITVGGDGKTVIWDHQNTTYRRNHYFLGKGGGVVRLGPGSHAVVSQGGPARVYTRAGGFAAISYPYGWNNQTIIDPASTFVSIYGFNPQRGDRLSFRGYFQNAAQLRAHCQVVRSPSFLSGDDLIVNLPGGGYVLMAHGGGLLSTLHKYVLDITDGWYGPGWTEPADILPGDADQIGPPVPPPLAEGQTSLFDAFGRPINRFDAFGRRILGFGDTEGGDPVLPPAPENPLLPYYQSGAILIHHTDAGFVRDVNGKVTAIANAGAAGEPFDATVAGQPLQIEGRGVIVTDDSVVTTSQPADIMDVRLMFVIDGQAAASGPQVFGFEGEDAEGEELATLITVQPVFGGGGVVELFMRPDPFGGNLRQISVPTAFLPEDLCLVEIVLRQNSVTVWINGTLAGEWDATDDSGVINLDGDPDGGDEPTPGAGLTFPAFPIQRIGSGPEGGFQQYNGLLGDVLGILEDHPQAEDATAVARNWIAARFGITIEAPEVPRIVQWLTPDGNPLTLTTDAGDPLEWRL